MADVVKIVNGGLAIITNRFRGAGDEPTWVHWGTGGAAPNEAAITDTALVAPRDEARINGTATRETTTVANDTWQVVAELECAVAAANIDELGLFDSAGAAVPPVGGNLFMRGTFTAIPLNVGDKIEFTNKVRFADG